MRSSWFRRAAGTAVFLALLAPDVSGETIESTTTQGDVPPELVGRWLVVEQNRLPTGIVHPFARLWEIRHGREHLDLVVRRARLPEAIGTKLAAAASAGRPWEPDERDLRELAERWEDLPASATDGRRMEHRLIGPDAAVSGGNGLVIVVSEERIAGASPVRTYHAVYTVRDGAPGRLTGAFVNESTAETPAPVTITLKGDFQAYRLPAVPPRPRLRHLLDAFLGRYEPS